MPRNRGITDPFPVVRLSSADQEEVIRKVRLSMRRDIIRDVSIVVVLFGITYLFSAYFNLFEVFVSFVRPREQSQLDEFVIALAVLPLIVLFVISRRWRQTREMLMGSILSERALADAANGYRELFDSCTAGISRWSSDGKLQLANPAFVAMVGADTISSELRLGDLMDAASLADLLQRTLDGRHAEPVEMEWHAGVSTIHVRLTTGAKRDAGSGSFDLHTHDLTSERRLETQLRQAQKMEGIGRLAGGIAHDFNNLLTVIINEAELAKDSVPPGSAAHEALAGVLQAGERATILTRQLLTFSRRDTVNPTIFPMGDLVTDIARMLGSLIGEDVELTTRVEPGIALVRVDRSQMEQVLVNLAVNARDAMPAGGKFIVETGPRHLDEVYAASHAGVAAGDYVMIAVSDTGSGMTREVQDRLFEPFFTTKSVGRGTGLGLATSFGIVANAGGHIAVYSEPGVGTTMRVYLPRSRDVASVAAQAAAPVLVEPIHPEATILVVEDEHGVRQVAVRVLKRHGYTVLEAANGAEAIALLEADPRQIDLVISDMVMPGVSGRDLAARIAEIQPDTKIIFMSGYTDDIVLKHQMLEHNMPFIQKPFTVAGFASTVHAVLDNVDSPRVGTLGALAH